MLLSLIFLASAPPSIETLDRLAQAKDVAGISRYVENLPAQNPLDVIRTNGPYEVGSLGWHALNLDAPSGKKYVVISTPLTGEDVGELLFARDGDKLRLVPEDQDLGVHLIRHFFDLRFDIPAKKVSIIDDLKLRSEGQGDFTLRFGDDYRVSSIVDSKGARVPFAEAGGVVVLKKPPPGESTFRIQYQGIVDRSKYAGSISDSEATLANEYWYPMVAREPAPYDLTVHAPKAWQVVGQGERLEDRDTEAEHISTFRMDLPVVFFSLSAGPYKTSRFEADSRTYRCWSPRMSDAERRAQAETYAPIIRFYGEHFGTFPFKSYGALDSPGYGGGALEAYSYATYGGGLPEEDAHEPSHTWWGGIICNTYLHSFWNESFADFSDDLYRRECDIGNKAERRLAFTPAGGVGDGYDEYACAKAGADRGGIADSLGYGKGAQVLGMLEQLMGTASMVAAMHRWIATQPKGKAGEWEDFERVAESERPDLHLESFFADWLDKPGHVDLDADARYQPGEVRLDLRFKGEAKRIPLEVLIRYEDGSLKLTQFDVHASRELTIPSERKPQVVSIDPYLRLIRPIAESETPVRLERLLTNLRVYAEPAHQNWAEGFRGPARVGLPPDPAGCLLAGSPETSPMMAQLCKLAGFKVTGGKLTYDGTTVNLSHGGAMAVVDLPGGGQCVIALGHSRIRPNPGHARLALYDDLGRFLWGMTEPKLSGPLTLRP